MSENEKEIEYKEVEMVSLDDPNKKIMVKCRVVADPKAEIENFVDKTGGVKAAKDKPVLARDAKLGEEITSAEVTTIDGEMYKFDERKITISQKEIDSNAKIITNPAGKFNPLDVSYVCAGEKFPKLYDMDGETCKPKGVEKTAYPITENFAIYKPSWGIWMYGFKGGMAFVEPTVNKETGAENLNITSITDSSFKQTYNVKSKEDIEIDAL